MSDVANDPTLADVMAALKKLADDVRRIEVERVEDGALITISTVSRLTTLSEREIYRRVAAKTFPAPKKAGDDNKGRRAWEKRKVLQWIKQLPEVKRDEQASA